VLEEEPPLEDPRLAFGICDAHAARLVAITPAQRSSRARVGDRVEPSRRRRGHAARLLVVDDHKDTRELLAIVLRQAGYETLIAPDGVEAMQLYRSARPELVIVDIVMPRKDGIETIRELRSESSAVVIIAISSGWELQRLRRDGRLDHGTLSEVRDLGADLVLRKPFDPALLAEAVKELLEESA
jgi:CheY-like chemotaxis protein